MIRDPGLDLHGGANGRVGKVDINAVARRQRILDLTNSCTNGQTNDSRVLGDISLQCLMQVTLATTLVIGS